MAFALATDTALDAIRDALGTTVSIGTADLTWVRRLEGDPLRWQEVLDDAADYPSYIMRPGQSRATGGTALKRVVLPVTTSVIVRHQDPTVRGLSPKAYKAVRLVGEACVAAIEDAGHHMGTTAGISDRQLIECGVDYDLTEAMADHGLAVYSLTHEFIYYVVEEV